jgi:hypothetical protein
MNKSSKHLTLGATLFAAASLTTHAQTWVNVYDPAHGSIPGYSSDIRADAAGNLYAVGSILNPTDGSRIANVLGSSDQGATWNVLDQYVEPGLNYGYNRAVAADPLTGSLLAGGNLSNILPDGTAQYKALWYIREWTPATSTWSTVDDWTTLSNDVGQASCSDILVTPSGDVYATGGSESGFLVRRRSAGASMFTTVDADYSRQSTGAGWGLAYHPSYGVLAAGEVNGSWTVRRSVTGNPGSWGSVDTFKTSEWTGSGAEGIVTTDSGAIHVAGWAYSSRARKYYWMVRSSYDGGATWSISDTYSLGGSTMEAETIRQDGNGNLFVCGQAFDSAGKPWWLVRKGVPGTTKVRQGGKWVTVPTVTWSNSDVYRLATGQPARANGLAVSPSGTVFASGWAADASGVARWIVRKLAP